MLNFDKLRLKDGLFIGWTTFLIFFVGYFLFMIIGEFLNKSATDWYNLGFIYGLFALSIVTVIPLTVMFCLFHNKFSRYYFPLLIPILSLGLLYFSILLIPSHPKLMINFLGNVAWALYAGFYFIPLSSFILSLTFSIGDFIIDKKKIPPKKQRKFWLILEVFSIIISLLVIQISFF